MLSCSAASFTSCSRPGLRVHCVTNRCPRSERRAAPGPISPRSLVAVTLCCAVQGCLPYLTHGPRVERGLSLGFSGGFTLGRHSFIANDTGRSRPRLFPALGMHLTGGVTDNSGRGAGFRATYQMALYTGQVLDLYIQAPPILPTFVAGTGVLLQWAVRSTVAPYLMLGKELSDGSAVFLAQGAAFTRPGHSAARAVLPFAVVGYQLPRPLLMRLFVTAYFGRQYPNCAGSDDWCRFLRYETLVIVGFAREVPLPRRGRRPGPLARPN